MSMQKMTYKQLSIFDVPATSEPIAPAQCSHIDADFNLDGVQCRNCRKFFPDGSEGYRLILKRLNRRS